jgi:hypothetical protein
MFRILFLILVLVSAAFAQNEQIVVCRPNSNICDPVPRAGKKDEFKEIDDADFKTHLKDFFAELQKKSGSQGVIINYGSETEIVKREKLIVESTKNRKYDSSRLTLVRGGNAEIPKTEFWIVPPGAENPVPDYDNTGNSQIIADNLNPVVMLPGNISAPERLEEFGAVSDRFFKYIIGEFFGRLERDKSLKGYVFLRGTDQETVILEERIRFLDLFQQKNSERVIFVKGDAKDQPTTALWLVPEGAELPPDLITK